MDRKQGRHQNDHPTRGQSTAGSCHRKIKRGAVNECGSWWMPSKIRTLHGQWLASDAEISVLQKHIGKSSRCSGKEWPRIARVSCSTIARNAQNRRLIVSD